MIVNRQRIQLKKVRINAMSTMPNGERANVQGAGKRCR